tara:strand:+ start:140 stop:745 length:606 start_codon:yes stop_codon:yes gene_type:complete
MPTPSGSVSKTATSVKRPRSPNISVRKTDTSVKRRYRVNWQQLNRKITDRDVTTSIMEKVISQEFRKDLCSDMFTIKYIMKNLELEGSRIIIFDNPRPQRTVSAHKYDVEAWAIYKTDISKNNIHDKNQLFVQLLCARQGLGEQLLKAIIKRANEEEKTEILLIPIKDALEFYTKHGFENEGEHTMKLTKGKGIWRDVLNN